MVCEHFSLECNAEITLLIGLKQKNEVFGGNSTHERAPPAVLATHCRNLPISSTNLKLLT